jgi:hypothetical protein
MIAFSSDSQRPDPHTYILVCIWAADYMSLAASTNYLACSSSRCSPYSSTTLSRASDIDHSKEFDKNQGATRLQLPQSNDILLEQQVEREQRASQ